MTTAWRFFARENHSLICHLRALFRCRWEREHAAPRVHPSGQLFEFSASFDKKAHNKCPPRECVYKRPVTQSGIYLLMAWQQAINIIFISALAHKQMIAFSNLPEHASHHTREMLSPGSSIKFHALGILGPVSVFNGDGCWVAAALALSYLSNTSLSIPHISLDASEWWGWAIAPRAPFVLISSVSALCFRCVTFEMIYMFA